MDPDPEQAISLTCHGAGLVVGLSYDVTARRPGEVKVRHPGGSDLEGWWPEEYFDIRPKLVLIEMVSGDWDETAASIDAAYKAYGGK